MMVKRKRATKTTRRSSRRTGTRRLPRTTKISKTQTGKRKSVRADRKKSALPPGKRLSTSGKVYYERRRNRSDKVGSRL